MVVQHYYTYGIDYGQFFYFQVFTLSVTEIGTVMSLGAKDSCEFFHDPFKGKRYTLARYEH